MTDTQTVERATIGHNQPPEPTPFELIQNGVNDLYDEAKLWLDGEPITTEKQASSLAVLGDNIKEIAKEAEALRVAERKPHLEANKAIQAIYLPLLDKAEKALAVLDEALKPFMVAKQQAQDEAAKKAREEADQKQREAEEAIRAAPVDNLAEREAAEALIADAKKSEKEASRAAKARPNVKGEGRARTLVTTYEAEVVDHTYAGRAMWKMYPDEYHQLTATLCQRTVDNGVREIPGVVVNEHKNVRS